MNKFHQILLALAIVCFGSAALQAQTSFGTIAGSVTDQSGAVVSGATVTVTSKDTGETHKAITSSSGGYKIEALGTGTYDVTAEAPGFSKNVVASVVVAPSTITSVSPNLKVGNASETVEVSSTSEILQTESGEVSATLSGVEIAQLPINGLNGYTLVTTLPGVTAVTVGTGGNGPKFSVNGLRPRANNYLIEGQDNNDAGLTGQAFQPSNTESVDNITFLLNSFNAEFGNGGGAISNLVFKSGTNQFHGSVFDRLFNSSLNATDHNTTLNGGIKSKTRENIYGFTIGGPIVKNKLFIFGAYQQDHFRSSSQLNTLIVPTAAGYAVLNNFKANNPRITNLITAYGGLIADPTKFASSLRTISLGPDPVTGVDRGNVQYGGFQRTAPNNSNASEIDLKGDYLFNQDKDKLQLRYIRGYSIVPYDTGNFPAQLPLFDTNQGGPSHNAGIVETHQFNSHLLNEFRLSYTRINFLFDLRPDTYSNPLALGPTVSITSVQGYGIPTNVPQGRGHNTYQLQDALSYTFGNHSIKVGFDVNQIRVRDAVPFTFYGTINYGSSSARAAVGAVPAVGAYTALANYLDGFSGYTSSTGQAVSQQFGNNIATPKLTNQNYYIQDHWKASPRLALDYGLRYEYNGAPFNYLANPATDFANPFASFATRVAEKANYKNFAPRLGFAYTPEFGGDKLVVRGGFGIFYDHLFTNIVDNIQASAPNAASPIIYGNQTVSGRGTPNFASQFANLSHTPLPTNSQTTISSNLRTPLTYQYNLALEQALPGAMSLTVAYAGTRGLHLYSLETLNPVIFNTVRVNTSRGLITGFGSSGDSNYNGVSVELQRKYRSGLLARVSYTYGKGLDDVSDPYSSGNLSGYPEIEATLPNGAGAGRGRDWGPSAYDHKQRAVLSAIYNTPIYHPTYAFGKFVAALVNTYEVSTITSFQTGSVFNVFSGVDINGDGISNDRPVLTNKNAPINTFSVLSTDYYAGQAGSGPGVYCDGSYVNNATTKNPVTGANDAFCHIVPLNQLHYYLGTRNIQNATINRNADYTPGIFNMDATAQRSFHIHESQRLDFRAEAFNVLNHANTGVPSYTLFGSTLLPIAPGYGTGSFGNYASTGIGGRTLRFFAKFVF